MAKEDKKALKPLTASEPIEKIKPTVQKAEHSCSAVMDKKGAFGMGFQTGYAANIMPPEETFVKVSSKLNIPIEFVRAAYIKKASQDMELALEKKADPIEGAMTGGGLGLALGSVVPGIGTAVGGVGGALLGGLHGWLKQRGGANIPGSYQSQMHDPYMQRAFQAGQVNKYWSSRLQALNGAHQPAPNPWGNS